MKQIKSYNVQKVYQEYNRKTNCFRQFLKVPPFTLLSSESIRCETIFWLCNEVLSNLRVETDCNISMSQ